MHKCPLRWCKISLCHCSVQAWNPIVNCQLNLIRRSKAAVMSIFWLPIQSWIPFRNHWTTRRTVMETFFLTALMNCLKVFKSRSSVYQCKWILSFLLVRTHLQCQIFFCTQYVWNGTWMVFRKNSPVFFIYFMKPFATLTLVACSALMSERWNYRDHGTKDHTM